MKYDLKNFYNNLKIKFNESNATEIFLYMIYELKFAIKINDIDSIIFIANELASYLRVKADTKNSYKIYEIILKLINYKYGCNSLEYATILLNLADVDIVAENYQFAIDKLNKSEKILEKQNNKYLLATMHNNRSAAYRRIGNYKKAREDIEKAIELIEDKNKIAISMINLSEIKLKEKNLFGALNDIKNVIEYYIFENSKDIHFANALSTAGNIYFKLEDYDRSIKFYKLAYDKFYEKFGECEITKLLYRNIEKVKKRKKEY